VIRKCIAIAACVAFQAMIIELPALHAHLDDHDTAHHQARIIHAHFDTHPHRAQKPGGPVVTDNDHDRASSISAVAAVASRVASSVAVIVAPVSLATPAIGRIPVSIARTRGHDPPWLSSLPARAPPSFLS
jgi:hypothetical protein